jgi:hypothetical protein
MYSALGAFGSIWVTELAIANTADVPITVFGFSTPCGFECTTVPAPIPPRTTIFTGEIDNCVPSHAHILITDRTSADNIFLTLRTHDRSRDDKAWGSIVPVLRERDRFTTAFSIVNVPVGPRFRALLRLYAMNASAAAGVRVRFLTVDPNPTHVGPDALISEVTPAFSSPGPQSSLTFCPAYAEIPLSSQPSLLSASQIRLEIVPNGSSAPAQQYWGFVSVTNNDTQEVSIISPN